MPHGLLRYSSPLLADNIWRQRAKRKENGGFQGRHRMALVADPHSTQSIASCEQMGLYAEQAAGASHRNTARSDQAMKHLNEIIKPAESLIQPVDQGNLAEKRRSK